eukprot:537042-Pyramimonas_sp.AAC.1
MGIHSAIPTFASITDRRDALSAKPVLGRLTACSQEVKMMKVLKLMSTWGGPPSGPGGDDEDPERTPGAGASSSSADCYLVKVGGLKRQPSMPPPPSIRGRSGRVAKTPRASDDDGLNPHVVGTVGYWIWEP